MVFAHILTAEVELIDSFFDRGSPAVIHNTEMVRLQYNKCVRVH